MNLQRFITGKVMLQGSTPEEKMSATGRAARLLLRTADSGVLSTLSVRHAGHPFGSVVTYALDERARPLLCISRLAEHTRNIQADGRCSLLVREQTADVQASARLTILAMAECCPFDDGLVARYLRHRPDARALIDLGDFSIVRLQPIALRYIAGFGEIGWVSVSDFTPAPFVPDGRSDDIAESLNDTHAQVLRRYCGKRFRRQPEQCRIRVVDCDGFDVQADDQRLRINFDEPLGDTESPGVRIAKHLESE